MRSLILLFALAVALVCGVVFATSADAGRHHRNNANCGSNGGQVVRRATFCERRTARREARAARRSCGSNGGAVVRVKSCW